MTERKPPELSFEGWIDRQIRVAQERGEFDDLAGAGQPLAPADGPDSAHEWAARRAREENSDASALLPPALALRKEIETLPVRLRKEHSEERVREIVQELNERIRQAHRNPQPGPVLRAGLVNVDRTIAAWRAARSEN